MKHRRRTPAAAMLAALIVLACAAAPAAAQQPPDWLKLVDGQTQPQFDFTQAIEETVYVETGLDTDLDGTADRVRIRISRPREAQERGLKVPVVFEHSPYRGDLGPAINHPVDVAGMPQEPGARERAHRAGGADGRDPADVRALAGPSANLPGTLDDYYVPRGYAVVLGESIGTFNSTGCPDVGADAETLGTKAVIDWLNGRARGFDASGAPVSAGWTTGDVGMTGVSYNGTLPNQVATTGVEGLKTIIPVAAISSWYDYYRANGLVVAPHSVRNGAGLNEFQGEDTDVLGDFIGGPRMQPGGRCRFMHDYLLGAQDRITGDYSAFWAARDYLGRVDQITASVFVVHGLNDFNVKTKAFAEWWYRLADAGVERKIWLHNGGHGGPRTANGQAVLPEYKRAENRWFDHELFGVPNGIDGEPRASVQRADNSYVHEADWPAPGTRSLELELGARSSTAPGTLGLRGDGSKDQSFVDNGRNLDADDVLIQAPDSANPNRLVYRTEALPQAVRISGTPYVDLQMSIDNRRAANLTAVLVDYAPDGTAAMVTRGWLDPQNRGGAESSEPIRAGKEYEFRWDLQPDDHVFAAGHRLGLVVVSTDHDYTLRPLPGTQLTLDPGDSELELPVVVAP
jgi:X-Pro dipeptidyl-peptidase